MMAMAAQQPVFMFAVITAIIYGIVFVYGAQSIPRSIAKTVPVALLALAAIVSAAPWLLVIAAIFSAVGDAFLARSGERRFLLGLAAFLCAHVFYIALFVTYRDPATSNWTIAVVVAIASVLVAAMVLRRLWPHLGDMRLPVIFYTAVIAVMGISAFAGGFAWPILAGVVAFMASDMILAGQP